MILLDAEEIKKMAEPVEEHSTGEAVGVCCGNTLRKEEHENEKYRTGDESDV